MKKVVFLADFQYVCMTTHDPVGIEPGHFGACQRVARPHFLQNSVNETGLRKARRIEQWRNEFNRNGDHSWPSMVDNERPEYSRDNKNQPTRRAGLHLCRASVAAAPIAITAAEIVWPAGTRGAASVVQQANWH